MKNGKLLTKSEYARHRHAAGLPGGTPAAVSLAIKAGRLTLIDGRWIDPIAADREWAEKTRPRIDFNAPGNALRQEEPDGEQDHGKFIQAQAAESVESSDVESAFEPRGSKFWEAATREKLANATIREFEAAIKSRALIDRESYERAAFTTGRMLRDAMIQTFPAKYAARLAPISDPWELEQRLREFIHEELDGMSRIAINDERVA